MTTPRVRDLLPYSRSEPSLVRTTATLREVVGKLIEDRATREVYVVDDDGRFHGLITVRRIARFVFSALVPDRSSATDLLDLLSAERAEELAIRKTAFVEMDDSFEHVIDLMLRYEMNEIPVVDDDGVIAGNLDLLEILAAWYEGRIFGGGS